MTRNLRPITMTWGPHSAVFIEPEQVEPLFTALVGKEIFRKHCQFAWNDADEVYRFWAEYGARLLDRIRDCTVQTVVRRIGKKIDPESVRLLLLNLKNLEPQWRKFLEPDGQLLIWIDGY